MACRAGAHLCTQSLVSVGPGSERFPQVQARNPSLQRTSESLTKSRALSVRPPAHHGGSVRAAGGCGAALLSRNDSMSRNLLHGALGLSRVLLLVGTPSLTLLLLLACSPTPSTGPLVLYRASAVTHQALVRGSLLLEDGCLYIVSPEGERWIAAFPSPGTRWNPEQLAVHVGIETVRLGERRRFSGGEVRNRKPTIDWMTPPAESCKGSSVWMVSAVSAAAGKD
jgi:hypothetical protein